MIQLLENFIEIAPIENTFFMSVNKPQVRFTKEVLKMNYIHLSPFGENSDLAFFIHKKKIYIWFFKNDNTQNSKKLKIPEALIIFQQALKKLNKNSLSVIVEYKKNSSTFYLVIKDGFLASQIASKDNSPSYIDKLKKEHSLNETKTLTIQADQALKGYLKKTEFGTFVNFLIQNSSLDLKGFIENFIEVSKMPLIVLFLLLNIYTIASYFIASRYLNKEKAVYAQLKEKNTKIVKKFETMEKLENFWRNFFINEMRYSNLLPALNAIAKATISVGGKITNITASGGTIQATIDTDSSSKIVQQVMKSGLFSTAQIISVTQVATLIQQQKTERAKMFFTLKPLKW